METKKFTQFGTLSVVIILPLFILFFIRLIHTGLGNNDNFGFHLFMALITLLLLLIFYKVTIVVSSTRVSFKLGVGFISKSYKIENLKRCVPIVNKGYHGIGIHAISNGWLYNVSGLKAIELQFKNSRSIVRIGTNKPEEISQLIQSKISGEAPNYTGEIKVKKWIIPLYLGIFILIFILAVFPIFRETKVQFNNHDFRIRGSYGETIPYANIELIDTVSILPKIIMRTNGYALSGNLIGNFRLHNNTNVKLFVKKGGGPYILIKSKSNKPIYLNFKSKQKTVDLYNKMKNKVN